MKKFTLVIMSLLLLFIVSTNVYADSYTRKTNLLSANSYYSYTYEESDLSNSAFITNPNNYTIQFGNPVVFDNNLDSGVYNGENIVYYIFKLSQPRHVGYIRLDGPAKVFLHDAQGQIVFSKDIDNNLLDYYPVNLNNVQYFTFLQGINPLKDLYIDTYSAPSLPQAPQEAPNVNYTNGSVIITWQAIANATGYKIYKDNVLLSTVSNTQLSYIDNDITHNTTYQYSVSAVVSNTDIPYNLPAPITIPPPEPEPTPTPTPPTPLVVNFHPNKTAIVVNIQHGNKPYTINWLNQTIQIQDNTYIITNLDAETDYIITVSDGIDTITTTVNTGSFEGFIPPLFPSPAEFFQSMISNFGVAGTISIAILTAAVSLGLIIVLGIWAWRLVKKWLKTAK